MLEKYYMYKIKYKEYIVMLKYGNFYEILGNDALIINKLFGYKLNKLSNTFKVGFPVSSLHNIISRLNNCMINYLVVDRDEIIKIRDFEINNYNKYTFDETILKYNLLVISKITKYLNDNLLDENITIKLEKIKEIINE